MMDALLPLSNVTMQVWIKLMCMPLAHGHSSSGYKKNAKFVLRGNGYKRTKTQRWGATTRCT
jgi:hypothetical protein